MAPIMHRWVRVTKLWGEELGSAITDVVQHPEGNLSAADLSNPYPRPWLASPIDSSIVGNPKVSHCECSEPAKQN